MKIQDSSANHNKSNREENIKDLVNFKGIYFGDENEKFQDPLTGAHFQYDDICMRLLKAKKERSKAEMKLNITQNSERDKIYANLIIEKND